MRSASTNIGLAAICIFLGYVAVGFTMRDESLKAILMLGKILTASLIAMVVLTNIIDSTDLR